MSYIDKEIKEAVENELDSIKLSSDLKNKIMLARAIEVENIQESKGLANKILNILKRLWNYEIEINVSYAIAALLIVVIIPLGYVRKEAKTLKTQKITVLDGITETIRQVDGK